MDSHTCEIRWCGPYKWYGTNKDVLFTQPEAKRFGIYLWTVPFKKQYLTYYVGETGKSFAERFKQHSRDCLDGFYRIFDPHHLAAGEKRLIWGGMWKPERKDPSIMLEFLNQYSELSPVIYEYLGLFRIFLAPLDVERRIRQRIEAAIATRLREQPGLIGEFQDEGIRYLPKRTDEEPITVRLTAYEPILGLCNELSA